MEKNEKDLVALGKLSLATDVGVAWLAQKGKWVLMFLGIGISLLFTSYHFLGSKKGGPLSDYATASSIFFKWLSEKEHTAEGLQKVKKTLSHHPELSSKFGALMAQKMLVLGDVPFAEKQAKEAFHRIGDRCPYYTRFSKTSLLVTKENFTEALRDAKQLKVDLEQDDAFWSGQNKTVRFGPYLYALNLFRIAVLEKQAGSPAAEKKAWEEVEKLAQAKGEVAMSKYYSPEAYLLLEQSFSDEEISLHDYIQYRKKASSDNS